MSLSGFAGLFNAIDFAYGCSGVAPLAGLPSALFVDIAPSATGAGTLTLSYGATTLTDGRVISPLATTAPITVGSGTNAETVTPSAVSVPSPGIYDTTTVTATFSNLHGKGDPVSSATFGLQEAINYASAYGGGTVIVNAKWAAAGGTQTILNTAFSALPANVQILDNRTGYGIYLASGTIANAAVKTLFSVGSQLIPAPGAGNAIVLQNLFLENVFLTAAFAAGGVIQASYGTGVTTPASTTVAATFLTSPAANQSVLLTGALASSLSSVVLNKAVNLACATADFTTGAGSIKWRAAYNVYQGL